MTRADEILDLVTGDENYKSNRYHEQLLTWMGERDDEELVEILRGAASTLAYRSVTSEDSDRLRPTGEVFMTALINIARAFLKHVRESEE